MHKYKKPLYFILMCGIIEVLGSYTYKHQPDKREFDVQVTVHRDKFL